LQFEVGIQTFNPEVQKLISRRQDNDKTRDNLRWLRSHTKVHVHADLIVGLPGESVESFAAGLTRRAHPKRFRSVLKRLHTPIVRLMQMQWFTVHKRPYEILSTKLTSRRCRMRFAVLGPDATPGGCSRIAVDLGGRVAVASFMQLSDWLYATTRQTHAIALAVV
jgi:hypothetical protein